MMLLTIVKRYYHLQLNSPHVSRMRDTSSLFDVFSESDADFAWEGMSGLFMMFDSELLVVIISEGWEVQG